MNEAPPMYDAETSDPISSPPTSELAIVQAQVLALQTQVATLLETQRDQLLKHSIIADPPIFNGKSWFREWYWKMISKLQEYKSFDEKTRIDYVVSRLTETAFLSIEDYLPQRLRYATIRPTYRIVETADELMLILRKKYN